jgi:hypothetical protein
MGLPRKKKTPAPAATSSKASATHGRNAAAGAQPGTVDSAAFIRASMASFRGSFGGSSSVINGAPGLSIALT